MGGINLAEAAGTLSHELQSGRHDWLRIYLSVASLLIAVLAVLQLLVSVPLFRTS